MCNNIIHYKVETFMAIIIIKIYFWATLDKNGLIKFQDIFSLDKNSRQFRAEPPGTFIELDHSLVVQKSNVNIAHFYMCAGSGTWLSDGCDRYIV